MRADESLKGRTAIVTGGGRGIGRAISRRLAACGASVAIVSRTLEDLDETRRLIEHGGGRVLPISADVSQEREVERILDEVHAGFGRATVLVNNAGVAPLADIEQMEAEVFDRIIATNVRAVYLCTRAVWRDMVDEGGGAIVNISSVAAYDPFPGFAAYGAAKAFVNAYTRGIAEEGAALGIRVYGIAPGAVETNMLRGPFPNFPKDKTLEPDEIAALVEVLLTPNCRYISGQTITIKKS